MKRLFMDNPISNSFGTLDTVILAGYFILLISLGILFSRRKSTSQDYFLAGRSIPVWAAGISFMATALSAATFIGGPQQAFKGNLTYLSSNIGSLLAVFVVALIFIPQFYRNNVTTVYQLLEIRFGGYASRAASLTFILGRIFASGARLYIAALPASLILFGDLKVEHQIFAISLMTVVAIGYTLTGGIRSVIWTDVIQTVIFTTAATVAILMLFQKIGLPIGEILHALRNPPGGGSSKLELLKMGFDGFSPQHSYTLLTAIFGFSLISLGAYGTDQDMTQRLLTCKSAAKGSQSAILGILVGIPVTALFMMIGLLLYVYYGRPDLLGANAPGYTMEESRQVFLSFILHEMPPGMTGLMMAGLFAAGLSSLNSAMNALSSAFITDFYRPLARGRDDNHYLKVGKIGVAGFGFILGGFAVLSVFWQKARPETTLIDFALLVMVFAYSGLVAVYLVALLTKRGNSRTIIAALVTGFVTVIILQSLFAQELAFPWQMSIATTLAFLVGVSGKSSTNPL